MRIGSKVGHITAFSDFQNVFQSDLYFFQCTLYKKQQGLFERLVQVYPQHASCINFVHLATKWHHIGQMAPSQVPRPTWDFQVSWGSEEQRADPPF